MIAFAMKIDFTVQNQTESVDFSTLEIIMLLIE